MPQKAPDYQPGQAIPGTVYRVYRIAGSGGMGTVYDVEDTTVGKRYVLKTLQGELHDRPDLAARLAREARALAKLQHPNIVEVYTSGTTKDSLSLPYYVMERLSGHSLRAVIARKPLSVEHAIDIGIDLLDALDHAHEFGIIHRDVKPDNIFITRGRDGRSLAKLLDFGIIKLATGPATSSTMHTGGRFIGTFRYAPPEQILGRDVTQQSDLYAAGLVIYEMIAGRGPFDDFTGEMEIGKAHIDVAPPPLSRFANVEPAIEQLVMSALAKDPALRPRDAFSFASTLRDFKRAIAGGMALGPSSVAQTRQELVEMAEARARPAMPFSAQPSVVGEVIPPSRPDTRIDAPAGKRAQTKAAAGPPVSGRSQTLSLGVLPLQSQETFAAAPIQMDVPAPVATPIDRRAETREAMPQQPPRPHYDTAPIPLAVLARPVSTPPPHPPSETFGAHTTEASQRKKSARSALVFAAVSMAFIVMVAVGAALVWKLRHATASAAPTQTTTTTTASAHDIEPVVTASAVVDTNTNGDHGVCDHGIP